MDDRGLPWRDERHFPIHPAREGWSIPWAEIAKYEERARKNHDGQSLETLAARGGLSWREALAVLEDRPFGDCLEEREAKDMVLALMEVRRG